MSGNLAVAGHSKHVGLNRVVVQVVLAHQRLAARALGNRRDLDHHVVAVDLAHDVSIAGADPGDRHLAVREIELPRQIGHHANAGFSFQARPRWRVTVVAVWAGVLAAT